MKRYIAPSRIIGMSDLSPRRTGLKAKIWIDHGGINRSVSHRNTPRVKIGLNNVWASVTISDNPKVLTASAHIKKSEWVAIQEGMNYVANNHQTFLKFYIDVDDSFDEEDFREELRRNGYYR